MTDFAEALGIATGPGRDPGQSLAAEVPVRVRGLTSNGNTGAEAIFEPFCEDTFTVLVSSHRAVLRLAAHAAPGQEIVLSSPRLSEDLPGRVVRYRSHPNVKGYAEVEFTDAAPAPRPTDTQRCVPLVGVPVHEAIAPEATPRPSRNSSRPAPQTREARLDSHGSAISARLPVAPPVVTPLADLLPPPPRRGGRVAHSVRSESGSAAALASAGAATWSASEPAVIEMPRTEAPMHRPEAQPHARAASVMDIEALLNARRADAEAQRPEQEIAQRLLDPAEHVAFAEQRRPRKRWMGAAAAAVLTLGAIGAWGVVRVTSVSALEPIPQIAAFAKPEPPALVAQNAEVVAQAVPVETEPIPIPSSLADLDHPGATARRQVTPMQAPSAPRANRASAEEDAVAPEPIDANAAPLPTAASGALDALAPHKLAAPAPPPPKAPPPVIGGRVQPPRLVSQAPVIYPQMARISHIEGNVVIDARIDETGRVVEMRVISGPGLLHQAAKDSLGQWRYEPGQLNGKPISTHLYVTIQFRR